MSSFLLTVLGILFAVGLFLLLREVFCWYSKINERLKLQQETNALLKKILEYQSVNNKVIEEKSPPKANLEANQ